MGYEPSSKKGQMPPFYLSGTLRETQTMLHFLFDQTMLHFLCACAIMKITVECKGYNCYTFIVPWGTKIAC